LCLLVLLLSVIGTVSAFIFVHLTIPFFILEALFFALFLCFSIFNPEKYKAITLQENASPFVSLAPIYAGMFVSVQEYAPFQLIWHNLEQLMLRMVPL